MILPVSELEDGDYKIHVISNVDIEENDLVPYAVSSINPFTQSDISNNPIFISMQNTNECIESPNDKCDKKGKLKCNNGFTGQLCDVKIQDYPTYESFKQ